jgi:hypothetical protein
MACDFAECAELAFPLRRQLSNGYRRGASVLKLPDEIEDWEAEHRTARKRANAAERNGYVFGKIRREDFTDDVYAINTSALERQGRPMSDGYLTRPEFSPLPAYHCARHRIATYGVLAPNGHLVAYTWVYRAGELVMFSSILGHAEHLERHVMYLLVRGALNDQIRHGEGVAFYNLHDSGTDGLRFFKERCGFAPADVEWLA